MAADLFGGTWRRHVAGLTGLAIAATLVTSTMPSPASRHYPRREPVRFWHMWTAEWKVVVDRIVERFKRASTGTRWPP